MNRKGKKYKSKEVFKKKTTTTMASDAFISEADDLMEKLNNMTDDAAKDFEEDDNNDENDNNSALNVSWADAATSDEDEEDLGEDGENVYQEEWESQEPESENYQSARGETGIAEDQPLQQNSTEGLSARIERRRVGMYFRDLRDTCERIF